MADKNDPYGTAGVRRDLQDTLERSRKAVERAERLGAACQWKHQGNASKKLPQRDGEGRRVLPVCSHCTSVRNASDVWARVPNYLLPADTVPTHGVCRDCWEVHYAPFLQGEPYPEPSAT